MASWLLHPTKTRFFLGAKLAGKVPVGLLLPQLPSRSGTEAYHQRISRTRCRLRRLRRSLNPGLCLVLMLIIYHLTIYANTRASPHQEVNIRLLFFFLFRRRQNAQFIVLGSVCLRCRSDCIPAFMAHVA
ncbi:hypothetical protein GQ55_5G273000 [Panicum hallii var. hallii]|uniref:Uncharacterized protein n=1 Tax=Panicum hallii var. hallii TaxID=1504633 RepID=A0A2T7DKP1_9POAL|nr:hypothetical protein GQ55_5G273000 [Panicum hallii var. hallii]